MRLIRIWLILVVIIFFGGLFYFTESFSLSNANGAEIDNSGYGEANIGGPFNLTDQNGKKISDQKFRGKFMLVYFGFTNCPGICPLDMEKITEALKKLGSDAGKIAPIFITVDPARDDPKQLAKYLKNYYPKFTGLTGSAAEIKAAEKAYKVYAEDQGNGMFNHSSNIYLMDKQGKYLTHFLPGTDADNMVAGIKKYLK